MTRILTILLAGAALALLPGDVAPAGCRHVAVHHQKQAAVVFAPQYGNGYLYSVGAPLQYRAMIEQAKAELRAEAQQLTTSANNYQTTPNLPAPETLPLVAHDKWANTKQVCAGCHQTKESAMEAFNMADFSALTCDQKLAAVRNMVEGKMPPPGAKEITPEQLGQIIGEFAGAENVIQP